MTKFKFLANSFPANESTTRTPSESTAPSNKWFDKSCVDSKNRAFLYTMHAISDIGSDVFLYAFQFYASIKHENNQNEKHKYIKKKYRNGVVFKKRLQKIKIHAVTNNKL